MKGELLAEGIDIVDAPKENGVEPKTLLAELPDLVSDEATVELTPKLGVEPKPELNTLVGELPDLVSDEATVELSPKLGVALEPELNMLVVELLVEPPDEVATEVIPKLGAEELKRDPAEADDGVSLVPEPNLNGTTCVTAVNAACVFA
ncbi:hypothetical protein HanXRQr2_Chr07g0300951 [Helianthus annuus]|uniref:Uncharacterized protein n=1 Tax=Helianthus annuus TaxID=4232 RepID=A0A9K3IMF0_HELAN|nr:hypothetical protein HanXRQr2_Chr07g0300951 [Helianthus annuus]